MFWKTFFSTAYTREFLSSKTQLLSALRNARVSRSIRGDTIRPARHIMPGPTRQNLFGFESDARRRPLGNFTILDHHDGKALPQRILSRSVDI